MKESTEEKSAGTTPAPVEQTSNPAASKYLVIPIKDLQESAANPRKTFDPAALQELADSLRSKGLIEPIVVRPIQNGKGPSGRYELVAGARRLRAAKMAALTELPAIVREYSEAEALEIRVIENLQREDLSPIEEAEGYLELVKVAGYMREGMVNGAKVRVPDVDRIAKRIGKSRRYVYDRLTLAEKLIPEAREAGAAGWITASHLVELARLQPAEQQLALEVTLGGNRYNHPKASDLQDTLVRWRMPESEGEEQAIPVKHLQEFIETNINKPLRTAIWDTAEVTHCFGGSCLGCMKRSDSELGCDTPITAKSQCLDPQCFEDRRRAKVKLIDAEVRAKTGQAPVKFASKFGDRCPGGVSSQRVKEASKSDAGAVPAIDVSTGKTKYVKVLAAANAAGGRYDHAAEEEKRKKREAEGSKRAAIENAARQAALKEVLGKVKGPPTLEEFELIFFGLVDQYQKANVRKLSGVEKAAKLSVEDYRKLLLVAALMDRNNAGASPCGSLVLRAYECEPGKKIQSPKLLVQWGKMLGVNVQSIIDRERQAQQEPEKSETISGTELKRRVKDGAKKMKIKVGGRKAKR